MKKSGDNRESGIELIRYVPWGAHLCQFCQTKDDLIEILVPYFKAGLEGNEYCLWVTAVPLAEESAREAMRKAMPDFDLYLEKGQIEIVPHDRWYLRDGIFDLQMVLGRWIDKLDHALKQGYDGLRVTGNTAWLEKKDWKSFTGYEAEINKVVGNYRMIAICTYSLDRCSAAEVIDVVNNHQFALIRRQDKWQLMESTAYKQAEETLRRTEENFRRSLDDSPLGIRIVNSDGEEVYANKAMLDIYGYASIEELRTTPRKKRYTPESYAEYRVRKEKWQCGEGFPSNYEIGIVRKDGEIRHLEVFRKEVLWNGQTQFQVLYHDITGRKRAEDVLRESERNLREAQQLGRIGNWEFDLAAQKMKWSDEVYSLYERDKSLGPPTPDEAANYRSPDDDLKLRNLYRLAVKNGIEFSHDLTIKLPGGRTIFTHSIVRPVKDDKGRVVKLFGTIQDITGRKRAEKALRESEERYRSLFKNMLNGYAFCKILVDEDNKPVDFIYIDVNDAFEKLTGLRKQDVIGKRVTEAIPNIKELNPEIIPIYGEVASTGKPTAFEVFFKPLDIWLTISVYSPRKDYFVTVFDDITERKHHEEERQKNEKLESISILAGGIAHDFNNMLTAILGNVSLAQCHLAEGEKGKAAQRLVEAEKACTRTRDLTQQLLTFARGGLPIKTVTSISELIKEFATFALRGSSVRCQFDLPGDLRTVEADEGQISQVIHNLVLNAREAMPDGGEINIKAGNVDIGPGSRLLLSKGEYVEVAVADRGIGIPQEKLPKIFDPYFTTKPGGRGLGLATAYSIVKRHGGHITVESKVGAGTTFRFYLPASVKPVSAKKIKKAETAVNGTGRILVMDDEAAIRELLGQMLVSAGYEVALAVDGAEAVKLFNAARRSGEAFDAVILDITVPGGMGGRDTIKKLLEIDPAVRAVVSSGYANDPIMSDFKKYGFRAVVTKPYNSGQLLESLQRVITTADKP